MGIVREAEALDASLDRAFAALRETRAAASKMTTTPTATPVSASGAVSAVWQGSTAHAVALSDEISKIPLQIYEVLAEGGAPPGIDSAARQTADALDAAAAQLGAEFLSAIENMNHPLEDAARITEACSAEARTLQRRISAPVGKLMPIMQLRDSMDQRCSHIVEGAELAITSEQGSAELVEICLGAQLSDMAEALRDGGAAIDSAAANILELATKARTELTLMIGRMVLPSTVQALDRALEHRGAWANMVMLVEPAATFDSFLGTTWPDATIPMVRTWVDKWAEQCPQVSNVAEQIDMMTAVIAAVNTLQAEADALARSALQVDALADSLQSESAAGDSPTMPDDPVLTALWNFYTVDAERDVHRSLVGRLAG